MTAAGLSKMSLKSSVLEGFKQIVGPVNVLTDAEDLYVYSFERFFMKQLYPRLDVVIRVSSDEQAKKVIELADKGGLTVVRRGAKNAEILESTKNAVVLIDDAVPPELKVLKKAEEEERVAEYVKEIHRAGHGTFRNFALAMKTLFSSLPARRCLDCTICSGYCTVSPSFNGVETWSSKGRALLIRALSNGDLPISQKLVDVLYTCSLCGLCFAQCFEDTQVRKAILDVRRRITEKGLTPEMFATTAKNILEVGEPGGMPITRRVSWIKELPQISFPEKAEVLYWVGCVVAMRTPNVARAVAKVLNLANVDFTILGEKEGCCGYILLATGLWDEAKETASMAVKRIRETGAEALVTSCAGCYYTFKKMYPEMLGVQLPSEVFHISQFVERQLRDRKLELKGLNMRVTYHDPCSLGRHSNVYDSPRNVLKAVPDLQLVEMSLNRARSRCCGAGGGLWSFNNRVAMNSAYERLVNDAVPLDVDALTTACPTCHINMRFASVKKSVGIKVYDVMEIIELSLSKPNERYINSKLVAKTSLFPQIFKLQ